MPRRQDFKTLLEAAKKHLQLQKNFNLDMTLQQWERGYVEAALAITQGNLSQAAKLLGIHRTTLYSRMQNYSDTTRMRRERANKLCMYYAHFGLTQPPFRITPNTEFFSPAAIAARSSKR